MDQKELAKQVKPFGIVLILLLSLIFVSVIFFHEVEGWDYLNSYYYTIVTVATVGYGDYTPKTDVGKIGATVLIIVGIGLFSTFISLLVKRRALKTIERRDKKILKKISKS
ncbi:two pore domain potassium channel family protein [Candidatus Saccharibacteria bacterium]|nr:two pore domain potassium channel family protein [Candidatus Saccharibacteria bacterium]